MAKKKAGRKPKITADVVKKLEEAFALGASDADACLYAGITKPTLYEYRKKNPEFAYHTDALKVKPILKAQSNVLTAMNGKDLNGKDIDMKTVVETSRWYLSRKRRVDFGDSPVKNTEEKDNGILENLLKANLEIQKRKRR